MPRRRHISRAMRMRIHEAHPCCPFCAERIDLNVDRVEIAHFVAVALGGADEEHNMRVAHHGCHRVETAEVDIPQIAKAKRVERKHNGTWRRPKNIVPGSKASLWKKKLSGRVERRPRQPEAAE